MVCFAISQNTWKEKALSQGQRCEVIEKRRFGLCEQIDPENCPPYWSQQQKIGNPYLCKRKVGWTKSCKRYICFSTVSIDFESKIHS